MFILVPNMISFWDFFILGYIGFSSSASLQWKTITNEPVLADLSKTLYEVHIPDFLYLHAVIGILAVIKITEEQIRADFSICKPFIKFKYLIYSISMPSSGY